MSIHWVPAVPALSDVSVETASVGTNCLSNLIAHEAIQCHFQGTGTFNGLVPKPCKDVRPLTCGGISQWGPDEKGLSAMPRSPDVGLGFKQMRFTVSCHGHWH